MVYTTLREIPSVETYCNLRISVGLSAKSRSAAAIGLPNSLFAVQILYHHPLTSLANSDSVMPGLSPESVGMGRVIGDGGLFYQVVDIAVLPAHQGKGLGKMILKEIRAWITANVPPTGYISLIAQGRAKDLYAQYGFIETAMNNGAAMVRLVKE
ncbi:hypothetical protein HWV62_574 [Athelia sp. TMB]|nr:hypothetical protein HWV62_574 [Athelia sp. TMB]